MFNTKETTKDIYFFTAHGHNGFLSNFFPIMFYIDNIEFSCSEQAFMYYKCLFFEPENKRLLYSILQQSDPRKVKLLGRKVKNFDDVKWNEVKYDIMVKCVRAKFQCNEKYKQLLINTAPRKLYEASPYDKIWGIGFSASQAKNVTPEQYGQNLLGKVLEQVRSELC